MELTPLHSGSATSPEAAAVLRPVSGQVVPTAGPAQIGIVLVQLVQPARPAAQPEQLGHAPLVVQLEPAASLLQLADIRHHLLSGDVG